MINRITVKVPVEREFTLKLQVEDDFMEQNNGSILLHIQEDKVLLTRDREADVVLKTNIADLSSLVMGAIPLSGFCGQEEWSAATGNMRKIFKEPLDGRRSRKLYLF